MNTSIIIGLFVFILSFPAHSQDVFVYDRNGAKEYFERIDSIVQIKFKDGTGNNEKLAVVQSVNSKVNYSGISIEKRICIPVDKNNLPDYNKLKSDSSVVYANQSLQYGDGTIQIPTEKILARVKEGYKIKEVLDKLNIEYENFRRIGHNQNSYLIILKNGESVETANLLYESGCFEHAQPSFARLMTSLNTYYTDQWGLNNTGQNGGTAGIDINAPEAWQITEGCDDIVVAVLDQGVDLDHPDLAGNLLTGYDATDGSDGAVNGDCSGNYAHGTCCAGIIAAIDNTIGIKGVAPNCRIIPVRVMENNFVSYDDDATEGMNYAWETADVDVISCSWGGGSSCSVLNDEISYALELGRNGLGCVVVFSTGNDNSSVNYPANSNSDIIAVGAMSPCGERKNPSSCDGENWGSNYGSTLDLVAPGVFIPTTDIQNTAGYNDDPGTDGDYYLTFYGTSAATPHVAGVAALILSVNPDLTQDEVRDIIESTCTKIGSYNYSTVAGRNNGTWNNQTGYGCVNAYAAVDAVSPYISGPGLLCSSGATYSVVNAPPGVYVRWEYSNNIESYYGGNNWIALRATGNGEGWVEAHVPVPGCDTLHLPRKTIWAGKPLQPYDIWFIPSTPCLDQTVIAQARANNTALSATTYEWRNISNFTYHSSDYKEVHFTTSSGPLPYGTYVYVKGTNSCGSSSEYSEYLWVEDCGGGVPAAASIVFTPNPTSGETVLSIDSDSKETTLDETTEWDLEIYSETLVLKEKRTGLKGNKYTIQTSGWKEGLYIVRVKYGEEVLSGKLMVK